MSRKSRPETCLLRTFKLFGMDHLDPVMLAALADERPMLLIGPHGTAKSEMLNRLAAALGLRHRHYNAALLSFDDLLGYPRPDRESGKLEFVQTPASIWGAESVFLDEISRCRPETANKLFSIIHDCRIQGISLPGLRYRWSAMNPPPEADTFDAGDDLYVGSVPLDPALADRFAWIVEVPPLSSLSVQARHDIISRGGDAADADLDLPALVRAARRERQKIGTDERAWAVAWVEELIDPLRDADLAISGRRAIGLRDSALILRAASRALGRELQLPDAALLGLTRGLPHRAQGLPVEAEILGGIHRAACNAVGTPGSAVWRAVRAENEPGRKLALALEAPEQALEADALSQLVVDVLAGLPLPRRWALSLLVARHPGAGRLGATAMELVSEPLARIAVFETGAERVVMTSRARAGLWDRVLATVSSLGNDPDGALLGNLLYLLFAEEISFDPGRTATAFKAWREHLEKSRRAAA